MGLPVIFVALLYVLYLIARALRERSVVLAISVPVGVLSGLAWLFWPVFAMPMEPGHPDEVEWSTRWGAALFAVFLISLAGAVFGLIQLALARRRGLH
jgi:prepilin signal peptidase PulO-like enzyme (type II secretory pathway)